MSCVEKNQISFGTANVAYILRTVSVAEVSNFCQLLYKLFCDEYLHLFVRCLLGVFPKGGVKLREIIPLHKLKEKIQ